MENKANRQEQAMGYLLVATGIFLWVSMFIALFGIWSWVLAGVYTISSGLLASCISEKNSLLKGALCFAALEALQIVMCTVIFWGKLF